MNSNLFALRQKIQQDAARSSFSSEADAHYTITTDAAGSGNSIIRFLPAMAGEEFPYVQIYNHAFQGQAGRWFIEPCPRTISRPCPVCESNAALLNTGTEANKALATTRKSRMNYVANILIIKDAKSPEKEGKVFLFKFGSKIMQKITDMIMPPFADMEPINPFDELEGGNFRLRVIKSGPFPNYDKSSFDEQSALGDDQTIEAALKQRRSLTGIVAPARFKSYDALKAKFEQIVGAEIPELSVAGN